MDGVTEDEEEDGTEMVFIIKRLLAGTEEEKW